MAAEAMSMRAGGYPVSSSAEACQDTASLHPPLRPSVARRDTDQILSYYHSDLAGRPYDHDPSPDTDPRPALSRHESHESQSSSEYSSESLRESTTRPSLPTAPSRPPYSQHTRRPSVPTQESTDRRRLAIIEVDSALPPSVSRKGSSRGPLNNTGVSSSSLLSRRGIHVNGLALVAPPDASPATYTNLTPPPTAPTFATDRLSYIGSPPAAHTHSRSASEAVGKSANLRRQTSRDVGIVGTSAIPRIVEMSPPSPPPREKYRSLMGSGGLEEPIFQTPGKSRSPSPGAFTPDLSNSTTASQGDSFFSTPTRDASDPALTPAIGEGKDVRQPVVGPVVVDLDSDRVMRQPMHPINRGTDPQGAQYDSPPASYLFYEPGKHSTAGPLPPPPIVSMFNSAKPAAPSPPPRPPRLRTPMLPSATPPPPANSSKTNLDALKESLQLPPAVSSRLASRSPSRADSRPELARSSTSTSMHSARTDLSSDSQGSISKSQEVTPNAKRTQSIHRREGAFPPSSSTTSPNDSPQIDQYEVKHVQPPNLPVVEHESGSDVDADQSRRPAMELRRESSWVSLRESNVSSSPNGRIQRLPEAASVSSIPRSPLTRSPSLPPLPPPKTSRVPGADDSKSPTGGSSNPFRATFNSLKRFSALPRTPSSLSVRSSTRGGSTPRTSRTPSPLPTPKTPAQPKIVNPNPQALVFRDIAVLKSPNERVEAYALKIKELSLCDTGLSHWLVAAKENGSKRKSSPNLVKSPSIPSELGARAQPRHVSHGSVDSEATFPRRADAYTATDLTMRADEVLLPESPAIPVPYPTLVSSPSVRVQPALMSPTRSYQVPLSSGPSRTGFFASIGRRASLRKGPMSPPSPSRVLKKTQHSNPPPPARPIQIQSTPVLKGGPRAPPHRISRSQTISIAPAPPAFQPEPPQPVSLSRSETMSTSRQSTSLARSETMSTSRQSTTVRRPSLFHRSIAPPPPPSGPDFEAQVDKLADLLPHADRNVLASYLRRAGQDILAIGQYLEDEKNGTLRTD